MFKEKKQKEKKNIEMSEAFITSTFLALSGGFQDAYTYFIRDHVFSNAQTGNVVLMSQHFILGQWALGLRYLYPLFAFVMGVFCAEQIAHKYKMWEKLHWRQLVLLLEVIILLGVGFIPESFNMVATVLVSFSCAMQVQAFRRVNGYTYASTMCIGNLRSGTEELSKYIRERKTEQLIKTLHYFGIIFIFAIGAGLGGRLSLKFGVRAIWISCFMLLVSFGLMFLPAKKD